MTTIGSLWLVARVLGKLKAARASEYSVAAGGKLFLFTVGATDEGRWPQVTNR